MNLRKNTEFTQLFKDGLAIISVLCRQTLRKIKKY
jgi:hypothetical protein